MAFQGIVTGFTPNDGQGDTLLAGAIKTNDNFRELYEALGDGTSIGIATLTQLKLSGILTATSLDVPNINLSGILTAGTLTAANVQVSGVVTANSFSGDLTGNVVANSLNLLGSLSAGNQVRLTSGGALQNIVSVATTSLNATGQSTLSNVTAGVITATNLDVSGNVSIAGTLTYEDVTNIDAIGLITARSGVQVDSGGIYVTGGDVGIGTTNSTTKLQVGSVYNPQVIGFGTVQGYAYPSTNVLIGDQNTGSSLTPQVGGDWKGLNNNFIGAGAGKSTTTGTGNNFFGIYAGRNNTTGTYNNFFGLYAGRYNTEGSYNNFFGGYYSSANTTGSNNNFFGNAAGRYNTTGSYNNFIGRHSGYKNTTGNHNNVLGFDGGYNNTTGSQNNFIGQLAGYGNTSGNNNNMFGLFAGVDNTTGSYNNFFGSNVASQNTTGSHNTIIGRHAGRNNTTGNYNLFVGSYTGISNTYSNKIILGRGFSNTFVFDSPNTTSDTQLAIGIRSTSSASKYWLVGDENFNIGIGSNAPTAKLDVNGTLKVSGVATFSDIDVRSYNAKFGTITTSQITLNGNGGTITKANGSLTLYGGGTAGSEVGILNNSNIHLKPNTGGVDLYYGKTDKKFETTGYGASVFGSLGVGTDPGSNAFAVLGDARVIGILTVGESSVTIDGTTNELSVGTGVTLSHSNGIYVGDTRVHSTGFDIGSSSIHSTGATFGTFSVGIFTATVLKSTGIATFQNRIEGPGNFRVKESTGYVGINTLLPQNNLDVRGGVHIGGGDQIIIDGQDIYRKDATLNLRNQQATGGSEVQIKYQNGLSLKGGTDSTGGIELDAGSGFVKSPNGDFVIGSASTTGTDDQKLQVTGGAYVSGAMGIGSVSPERKLDVMGDLKVTENAKVGGIITATSFVGDGSGLTGVIPAASAGIGFKEEGVVVGTATTINFVGVGVTATVSNGVATIDISNDPGEVSIPGISTTGQTNLSEVDISGTVNMGGNLDIVGVTTVQGGLKVSGVTTFNNNVRLPDNTPIQFGTGQDLQIYHNGTNGIIHNSGDGDLYIKGEDIYIQTNDSEASAYFLQNGAVELYYDAVKKFETTGYGVTVSGGIFAAGIVTATQFIGDGSGLTGVTAAGSGVEIQNNGSSVGTAATINFASNVTASVTDGVATINATGGGGGGGGISEGLAIAYAIAL